MFNPGHQFSCRLLDLMQQGHYKAVELFSIPETDHSKHVESGENPSIRASIVNQRNSRSMVIARGCLRRVTGGWGIPADQGGMRINENTQLYEYLYPVEKRGERQYVSRWACPQILQRLFPILKAGPMASFHISLPIDNRMYEDITSTKRHHTLCVMKRIATTDAQKDVNSTVEKSSASCPWTLSEEQFQALLDTYGYFVQQHTICFQQYILSNWFNPISCSQMAYIQVCLIIYARAGAGLERDFYDFLLTFGGESMAESFMHSQRTRSWLYYTHDHRMSLTPREAECVNIGIWTAWNERRHYRTPRYWSLPLIDVRLPKDFPGCRQFEPWSLWDVLWPPKQIREIIEDQWSESCTEKMDHLELAVEKEEA